jgi:hypothetical protein
LVRRDQKLSVGRLERRSRRRARWVCQPAALPGRCLEARPRWVRVRRTWSPWGESSKRTSLEIGAFAGGEIFVAVGGDFAGDREFGVMEAEFEGAAGAGFEGTAGEPGGAFFGVGQELPDAFDGAGEGAFEAEGAGCDEGSEAEVGVGVGGEAGEDFVPAGVGAIGVIGEDALVGEGELATGGGRWKRVEVDGDGGGLGGEFGDGEGEDEAAGAVDFEIGSGVFDVLAAAAVGEGEVAADVGIDVGADHLAGGGGEEEFGGYFRVEEGIEDAFGGDVEAAGEGDGAEVAGGHGAVPFLGAMG